MIGRVDVGDMARRLNIRGKRRLVERLSARRRGVAVIVTHRAHDALCTTATKKGKPTFAPTRRDSPPRNPSGCGDRRSAMLRRCAPLRREGIESAAEFDSARTAGVTSIEIAQESPGGRGTGTTGS